MMKRQLRWWVVHHIMMNSPTRPTSICTASAPRRRRLTLVTAAAPVNWVTRSTTDADVALMSQQGSGTQSPPWHSANNRGWCTLISYRSRPHTGTPLLLANTVAWSINESSAVVTLVPQHGRLSALRRVLNGLMLKFSWNSAAWLLFCLTCKWLEWPSTSAICVFIGGAVNWQLRYVQFSLDVIFVIAVRWIVEYQSDRVDV